MSKRSYQASPDRLDHLLSAPDRHARRSRGQFLSVGQRRRRRAEGRRQCDRRRRRRDAGRRCGQPADAHDRRRVPDPAALGGRVARDRGERQYGRADEGYARGLPCARAHRRAGPGHPRRRRAGGVLGADHRAVALGDDELRGRLRARRASSQGRAFRCSVGLRQQHKYGLVALREKFLGEWPASGRVYLPGGRVPDVGEPVRNPALARTYDWLANLERGAGGDRSAKLAAVHDGFYRGEVAAEIVKFSDARDGLLEREDFARFETRIEEPARLRFGDTELYKCGFWTQGPAELQTIALMSRFDLKAMGPASADYCHLLIEAMKLAFADREQYYGDPTQAHGAGRSPAVGRLYGAARATDRSGLVEPGAAPGRRRAAMRRCCPRTSASRRSPGAPAPCTWTPSTRRATWPRSRRAAPG